MATRKYLSKSDNYLLVRIALPIAIQLKTDFLKFEVKNVGAIRINKVEKKKHCLMNITPLLHLLFSSNKVEGAII
jgi:hypothetical protein